jgi:hypothetical protein
VTEGSRARSRVHIRRLDDEVGAGEEGRYAAVIASVGYEDRARHVAECLLHSSDRLIASTFPDNRVLSFQKNLRWFEERGAQIIDDPPGNHRAALTAAITKLTNERAEVEKLRFGRATTPRGLRLAVDISSMTRSRIAETVLTLYDDYGVPIDVDFMYSPAAFAPGFSISGPIRVNTAVSGFEGWSSPRRPAAAILGAGFEGELALGALDWLEPATTWVLLPHGLDARYNRQSNRRNAKVVEAIPSQRLLSYSTASPYRLVVQLDSLVEGLARNYRVVLVPLGPKIFALAAMLVALLHSPDVEVWRVSADTDLEARQRRAQGDVVGVRVLIDRLETSDDV